MPSRNLVLFLALASLVAKLYCASTTIGSSDVVIFWQFAHLIDQKGILGTYQHTEFFNHTPLVGWYVHGALKWSGGAQQWFAFLLKLPPSIADFLVTISLVYWQQKTKGLSWWALALFAASPVAFMISGYHGNFDSVMAAGILGALLACADRRPVLSGIFLGLACNIKIIPLLLLPALFFTWENRRQMLRFSAALIGVSLMGWADPLLTIPAVFLKNVIGYSGFYGVWGVTYLLRLTGIESLSTIAFTEVTSAQKAVMLGLKVMIVGAALFLAWRRRKTGPHQIFYTVALIWAVFFVFAPGFGTQYLVWLAPCFLLADGRWYIWLTAASSVALFAFYTVISKGLPWYTGFTVHAIASQWVNWLLLPWLVMVVFLGVQIRKIFLKRAPQTATEEI